MSRRTSSRIRVSIAMALCSVDRLAPPESIPGSLHLGRVQALPDRFVHNFFVLAMPVEKTLADLRQPLRGSLANNSFGSTAFANVRRMLTIACCGL